MSTNEPPADQPADPYGGSTPPPPPNYGGGTPPPPPPAPGYGGQPSGGYSVGTAWSYGWSKFTAHLGQILIAVLVLVAVQVVIQIISYMLSDTYILSWLLSLASWVISMIIGAGIIRGALDITEGKELDPKTLLTPNRLGEVIVASLLISVLTFVGLILCVIPGLLVAFFTSFTLYFLMDRPDLGAIDAIKASFEFTKSNAGDVILWFLVCLATYIVGFLLCGVGLIAAIPVILIGTAYTYRKLNGQAVAA